jgi:hypothetical protein
MTTNNTQKEDGTRTRWMDRSRQCRTEGYEYCATYFARCPDHKKACMQGVNMDCALDAMEHRLCDATEKPQHCRADQAQLYVVPWK